MFIQVENLTKKFKNSLAVNKINFSIEKNKTVGLLGPMDAVKPLPLE